MQFAQQADKETVEIMQKKLLAARQELEETKKQIVIVQRNHDALAEKAKQDGPQ